MQKTIALAVAVVVMGFLGSMPPLGSTSATADASCAIGEKRVFERVHDIFVTATDASVSGVELGEANLNFLQALLFCGEISKSRYCSEATDLATKNVSIAMNQMTDGTRTPSDVIVLQKELRDVKTFCK